MGIIPEKILQSNTSIRESATYWLDAEANISHPCIDICNKLSYSKEELSALTLYDITRGELVKEKYKTIWNKVKSENSISLSLQYYTKKGEQVASDIMLHYIEFEGKEYIVNVIKDTREGYKKEGRSSSAISPQFSFDDDIKGQLVSKLQKLASRLCVRKVAILRYADDNKKIFRSIIQVGQDKIVANSTYHVAEMDFSLVLKGGCVCVKGFQKKSKEPSSSIEYYVGVPLIDAKDDIQGYVTAFDDKAVQASQKTIQLLKDFAHNSITLFSNQHKKHKPSYLDSPKIEGIYVLKDVKVVPQFGEIITKNGQYKKLLKQIRQVAPSDVSVLIHGESGTGKELLANAIHNMSLRCDERLVKVNCAALPSELIESELFGYERGAFTGATSRQIGSFELADHGTIFLDEIGELPLSLQGKLLRILQEGEFKRLGNPQVRKVNVRIIAATNKSLEKAVEKGTFREDLFFRLNVFPVKTIPLRERKEDILLLVKHFCEQYGTRLGKNVNYLPKRTLDLLEAYSWPGNVRELANMIERALIISSSDKLEVMQAWFLTKKNLPNKELRLSLREFEKEYILYTLESTNWRVRGEKGAAKILDLPPSTLESKMKKLNITRKKLNL